MTGPLVGLRVVDCSAETAAARAAGFLADYGADVVWVEPPGGQPARERLAVEYSVFHRGKRSVEADLSGDGREALSALLAEADVLVEDWAPATAAALGLRWQEVHARFPHLIHCSITGFGSEGSLRDVPGCEAIVHALVGTMAEQIGMRDGPIFEGLPFASIGAGYLGVIGILAALLRRATDGAGRHVDTSLLDGALAYLALFWGDTDAEPTERAGMTENDFLIAGSTRLICGSFLCADDRYISVHTGAVGAFGRLMKILGLDDRVSSSETGLDMGTPLSPEERDVLHTEIHHIFAQATVAEWVDRLVAVDVCGIPALQPGEVFDEPQAVFNEMVVRVADPQLGLVDQVAPAAKFTQAPAGVPKPAPSIGNATFEEVLTSWAVTGPRLWTGSADDQGGPLLDGVKILDLGAFFAGPYASRLLAELGADVIKLETIGGDPMRGIPPLFRAAQAGKRSLAIDLKDAELKAALHQLVEWADVVHHNMRPGAAERLGIGDDQVRAIKPSIIYGHAPGWGSSGPFALRQSFEPMMSGYVGANFEVGGRYNPPVYPQGNADPGNGLLGAAATLVALLHHARTGEGVHFEHPQLNATMTHVAHIVRRDDGEVLNAARLDPLQYGIGPLERLYETADGWMCLAALTDEHIAALGAVIGVDLLADERYATVAARDDNDYLLSVVVGDAFVTKDTATLVKELGEAGVPAAEPVPYNNHVFMRDAEQRRIGRVAECDHPTDGKLREVALLVRVSDSARVPHHLAPCLGEHNDDILASLGYSAEQVAALRERNVVR